MGIRITFTGVEGFASHLRFELVDMHMQYIWVVGVNLNPMDIYNNRHL